jgi:hypothetical protein
MSHNEPAGLKEIVRTSIRNNSRDGITGCLALANGKFNQVLEGPGEKLNPLIQRIKADTRHQNVDILGEWHIKARLFTGWAMALPSATALSETSLRIMTENGSGAQITGILLTLTEQPSFSNLLAF